MQTLCLEYGCRVWLQSGNMSQQEPAGSWWEELNSRGLDLLMLILVSFLFLLNASLCHFEMSVWLGGVNWFGTAYKTVRSWALFDDYTSTLNLIASMDEHLDRGCGVLEVWVWSAYDTGWVRLGAQNSKLDEGNMDNMRNLSDLYQLWSSSCGFHKWMPITRGFWVFLLLVFRAKHFFYADFALGTTFDCNFLGFVYPAEILEVWLVMEMHLVNLICLDQLFHGARVGLSRELWGCLIPREDPSPMLAIRGAVACWCELRMSLPGLIERLGGLQDWRTEDKEIGGQGPATLTLGDTRVAYNIQVWLHEVLHSPSHGLFGNLLGQS
ncbi:hypothetical protein E3N88_04053 [Mikania micrantha]|uniref:Uncharacterized protein n=1 Tax=Mikania micrantha TaxID=192012 RepID=A0A5N6PTB1_9ASTR|nr:hypothetical protein E3N88_04053 [Mikania micrantha]